MNLLKNALAKLGERLKKIRERIKHGREERADLLITHQIVAKRRFPGFSQWRHLLKITTPSEKKALGLAGAALALGLVIMASAWSVNHAVLVAARGGEYREGIVGHPRALNPILTAGSDVDQDIISLVYSGLYRYDAEGRLVDDLAADTAVSADGKTYTVTLRDAVFHDGMPLTADDVAYTFKTIMNPKWKSPAAKKIFGFTAAAADPKTVVFTLSEPNSYFTGLLTVGIIPKHVWEKISPESVAATDFNLKPIGSGPYRFLKFTKNSDGEILSYTIEASDDSPSNIDKITFKFFDDYETAVEKLSSNAVDGLNFIPTRLYSSALKIPNVTVNKIKLAQYTAVFMNPRKQPIFSDVNVRRALTLAVDRERIIREAMDGAASVVNLPLKQYADGTTAYSYDPAAAADLLEQAGYKLGEEGKKRAKNDGAEPLYLELTTINTEDGRRTAQIIKDNWETIGAQVNVIAVSAAEARTLAVKEDGYQAIIFGEILGPDGDPFPFWHSSQAENKFNLSKYSNRRVDELLEKARAATDPTAKASYLNEFQQIITADAVAVFLYSPAYLYPQSINVKKFSVSLINSPAGRFANVTDWYVKKKLQIKF